MSDLLKLVVVTDIHNGRNSLTKRGTQALELMGEVARLVDQERPDLLIDLGDRITDTDPATDLASLASLAERFRAFPVPARHLLGNHDVVNLTEQDNVEQLGHEMHSTSIDINGWHLVFWQANVDIQLHSPLELTQEDLKWLREDLAATTLPAVVFTHVPLDGASMTGNYYFEASPQLAGYTNVGQAQQIISEAGNVAACIAGHVHWNNISRICGIPYLSLQSLTESFTTQGQATGGASLIELSHDLHWRCHGSDPINLTVKLGGGNQRWASPLPPLQHLSKTRARKHRDLSTVKALLIDLDGVVYKGTTPIPGAIEFLQQITASGRKVIALTNNARASSEAVAEKLHNMGLHLPPSSILTSAQVLADWLGKQSTQPRVFFAAADALKQAVLAAGAIESDEPDWVVASIDESMTVRTLNQAVAHLARGAHLLASNPDLSIPTAEGQAAETGAVTAYLEAASGQRAYAFGKPEPLMFELALQKAGCRADEAVVIGDTFSTDILGANKVNLRSIWVESGNPADDTSPAMPWLIVPDIVALRSMFSFEA